MGFFDNFVPDLKRENVFEIDYGSLFARGIKFLFFDIDNTLVSHEKPEPSGEVVDLFAELKRQGFSLCLVSNNSRERVAEFNRNLGLLAVYDAGKPFTNAIRAAMAKIPAAPEESAFVGDQIFTDILAAKRLGIFAIIVKPINPVENFFFHLKRFAEKPFLRRYEKIEQRRIKK